jgi:pepF/M3 family oligoendopeptidase
VAKRPSVTNHRGEEMSQENSTPPRWDLSNVYPSLESDVFKSAFEDNQKQVEALEGYLSEQIARCSALTDPEVLAAIIGDLVDKFNQASLLADTIQAYIYSFIATDSYNETAKRLYSQFEQVDVRLYQQRVRFQSLIGTIAKLLPDLLDLNQIVHGHAFILNEYAEQSQYLMSESEESLAAELSLSGVNAWSKLQGTVTSQLTVDFELDGKQQKLPMPALINLRSHPDENVRRRAYEVEMSTWKTVDEPLVAAMNGVKGATGTLNRRRGRRDDLHSAIDQGRIDQVTLQAMLAAMEASFPIFRRYFHKKAARLGKDRLPWWDLFAPTGKTDRQFTYPEARAFILKYFEKFSPDLSVFTERAFDNNWIDAEQRTGKRGGAFCMPVIGVKESRILCNFDGSMDQVFTIAHELGHAFHGDCMYRANKTPLQRITPMTMAETASILCETIVFEAALAQAASPEEELALLETSLISEAQVIVDIYSRYLFEKEVFERRAIAELSAEELCEIMERAQKATYGDGLDENFLHKYMWTWKPHYYRPHLSFYNFPYAFGLLFGTGLYAVYQQRGNAFIPDYVDLLASTGEGTAAELAARFDIDIRQQAFWEDSIKIIEKRIIRYLEL